MKKFNLSPKEFMFLCIAMGAEEVYGIEDVYSDMSEDDVLTEVQHVQQSLEKKGYVSSDFDGNIDISDELIEIVGICAGTEKFISFNNQNKNGEQSILVFYFEDDTVVRSERTNDDYELSYTDIDSAIEEVEKLAMPNADIAMLKFDKENIPQIEMEKARNLILEDNIEEAKDILNKCLTADVANILIEALKHKVQFYSVTVLNFFAGEDRDGFKCFMYLNTDKGLISIRQVVVDLNNEVELESISPEMVTKELRDCLELARYNESGEDNNG